MLTERDIQDAQDRSERFQAADYARRSDRTIMEVYGALRGMINLSTDQLSLVGLRRDHVVDALCWIEREINLRSSLRELRQSFKSSDDWVSIPLEHRLEKYRRDHRIVSQSDHGRPAIRNHWKSVLQWMVSVQRERLRNSP